MYTNLILSSTSTQNATSRSTELSPKSLKKTEKVVFFWMMGLPVGEVSEVSLLSSSTSKLRTCSTSTP